MAEGGVQIAVYALEYRLGAPLVGIRQCAAPDLERNAEVRQFASLGEQGGCYLTQRVEPHYHGIQHHNEVNPAIEALGVALTAVFPAETKSF